MEFLTRKITHQTPYCSRGVAITETLIALPVLIMVIMGIWQAALLYQAKTVLNYAALQAARAGAVHNADVSAIRLGLARGLIPMFAPDSSMNGALATLGNISADLAIHADIKILNPTREAFDDFGVTINDVKEIPNDRLDIRPTSIGANSGLNIQDANLLKIQIRYGYQLKIPVVRWVFRTALNAMNSVQGGADAFELAMLAQNRLPIISTITVRMQTPARQNGAVIAKADIPHLDRIASNGNSGASSSASASTGNEGAGDSTNGDGTGGDSSSAGSTSGGDADQGGGDAGGGNSSGAEDSGGNGTGTNDGTPAMCGAATSAASSLDGLFDPSSNAVAGLSTDEISATPLLSEGGTGSEATAENITLPSLAVGNPIHVATGNKFQAENDLPALPGTLGLSFTRYYNSNASAYAGDVGAGWRHSFAARLILHKDSNVVELEQADGRKLSFMRTSSPTLYSAQRAADGDIEQLPNDGGYRWRWTSGRELLFDGQGYLYSMRQAKETLAIARDARGRTSMVTDPQGRSLVFTYYPNGRLAQVATPSGTIRFSYDLRGNLAAAIRLDGSLRRYWYEDARHPHHLTGISAGTAQLRAFGAREGEVRVATWAYDEQGRGVLSSHSLGSGKVSLKYGAGFTDVTDAFGRISRYHIEQRNGIALVTSIEGEGCDACGQADARYRYNDRYELTEASLRHGVVMNYDYDGSGRLVEIRRRENASPSRWQVRYGYTGSSRLPTKIERPSVDSTHSHTVDIQYATNGKPWKITERGYTLRLETQPDHTDQKFTVIERAITLKYDQQDHLVAIDGPRADVNDVTRLSYDSQGRMNQMRFPDGTQERVIGYDHAGRPARITLDGRPAVALEYDAIGRVLQVAQRAANDADIRTVRYGYDATGHLAQIVTSHGRTLNVTYDAAGRPMEIRDSHTKLQQTFAYDPDDQLIQTSIQYFAGPSSQAQQLRALYLSYDAARRLKEVRDGDGPPLRQLNYEGDERQPHSVVDPLGFTTLFNYDALGQLATVQAPDGGLTRIDYDAQQRFAAVTAPNAATTRYEYDDFGRRVAEHSADRGTTRYAYDAADNLIGKRDARGETIAYRHDAANQLIGIQRRDGETMLEYEHGHLTRIHGPWGEERTRYDAVGRPVQRLRIVEGQKFITAYEYNARGELAAERLPSGTSLSFAYTTTGELKSVERQRLFGSDVLLGEPTMSDVKSSMGRSADESLSARLYIAYGNGLIMNSKMDAKTGRLMTRDISGVTQLHYRYDEQGHVTDIAANDRAAHYAYDQMGRLTEAQTALGIERYRYDTAGNRISAQRAQATQDEMASDTKPINAVANSHTAASFSNRAVSYKTTQAFSGIAPSRTATYAYQPATQRLLSDDERQYAYDQAGNPVSVADRRYDYDPAGRPIKLYIAGRLKAEYRYNAFGERQSKKVYQGDGSQTTLYLYDNHQLMAEADQHGRVQREYLYVDRHPVVLLERGAAYYIHTDHLGTPIAMTDAQRRVVWRADYSAFGQAQVNEDPDHDGQAMVLNLRFPGQYADAESGTYYNYLRDYDPKTGRYLTSDPIGTAGGVNTFAYVHANPVTGIDRLGLYDEMVHYYATYFLGLIAGLPQDVARRIAMADQYVDENYQTEPIHLEVNPNDEALPLYHFVLDYSNGNYGDASKDPLTRFYNPQSAQLNRLFASTSLSNLQRLWAQAHPAPEGSCSLAPVKDLNNARYQLFGEYLHAYEDTFAHRDSYDMPYGIESNPANTPQAWKGHGGWGMPDAFGHAPDRTYNKSYSFFDSNDHTQCNIDYVLGGTDTIEDLTEAQCNAKMSEGNVAHVQFKPGNGQVWQYNELRTLRMDYEVFNKIKTNFASEIAANGNKTLQWSQIAGSADWNSSNATANARIGTSQTLTQWEQSNGIDHAKDILQQFNASTEPEKKRLEILNTWLATDEIKKKLGDVQIESWDDIKGSAGQQRLNNIAWIPAGSMPGVLLPKDATCSARGCPQ